MTYLGKDSPDVMEGIQGLDDIACGRVLDSPLTCWVYSDISFSFVCTTSVYWVYIWLLSHG